MLDETWDPEDHEGIDKVWCDYEQEWKAEDQMSWFLKNVSRANEIILFDFWNYS